MTPVHRSNSVIGHELPALRNAAELAAFESTPYTQRIRAQSTYEALRLGAAAFVQPRPGITLNAAELTAFVRERTPERAAVPVQIYFTDAIPLTAVGKVFKPALRLDATQRAVERLLAGLAPQGARIGCEVSQHAEHGNVINVRIGGVEPGAREALSKQIGAKLDPLTIRNEIVWV